MILERSTILEGAFNWRDLGGIPTTDGYEVKRGKLFRADALHRLTNIDLDLLAGLQVVTIVDLRSTPEITRTGKARLVELGARHLQIPVMENVSTENAPSDLGELYLHMVTTGAERFIHTVETLSSLENLPAVFHCTAGKDRTGITAALIYSLLDVDRDAIVADYVLTDPAVPKIMERIREEQPELLARSEGKPIRRVNSSDEILRAFLDAMDAKHGSPVAWMKANGLRESSIENLRSEMLA